MVVAAIMNPTNNVVSRHGYDFVKSIDTPDDVYRRRPSEAKFSPFVNTFFAESDQPFPVAPEHVLSKYPNINADSVRSANRTSATGRFGSPSGRATITSTLVRNDSFFMGKPGLDRIEIKSDSGRRHAA